MPIIDSTILTYAEVENIEFPASSNFDVNVKTILQGQILFPSYSSFIANPKTRISFPNKWTLMLEVVPSFNQDYYRQYEFRLLVDGDEVDIKSFDFSTVQGQIGQNLSIVLSSPDDKHLITLDSVYKFQIALINPQTDVYTWYTLLDSGKLKSGDFSISWDNEYPNDTFNFSTSTELNTKLEKAPIKNTVFYDSYRISLLQKDFEEIYDTNGKKYQTDLIPVSHLDLYTLFKRIYVDRCGFSSYKTNIPNYGIRRCDISLTESYNSAIAKFIGMFEPVIFVVDNVLWIISTVQTLPAGFPQPIPLTVDDYPQAQGSFQYNKVGAILLDYIENDLENMFHVSRIETRSEESGEFGTQNYTVNDIQETFFDFYTYTRPTVLVKSVLAGKIESIKNWEFVEMYASTMQTRYDSYGRETGSTIQESSRIPTLSGDSYAVQEVKDIETLIEYKSHPYRPGEQLQSKLTRRTRGLIAVDSTNKYFDQDFKQEATIANNAGNLNSDMIYSYGDIETYEETLKFLPNQTVRTEVKRVNHINNTVTLELSEPRPGENTIGTSSSSKPIIIMPEGITILTGEPLETYSIGELPLDLGIPLVKQVLKRRREKPYTFNLNFNDFEPALRQGINYSIKDRRDNLIGALIIEDYTISGSREEYVKINTSVRGKQI